MDSVNYFLTRPKAESEKALAAVRTRFARMKNRDPGGIRTLTLPISNRLLCDPGRSSNSASGPRDVPAHDGRSVPRHEPAFHSQDGPFFAVVVLAIAPVLKTPGFSLCAAGHIKPGETFALRLAL